MSLSGGWQGRAKLNVNLVMMGYKDDSSDDNSYDEDDRDACVNEN